MASHLESAYRLPNFEERRWSHAKTGEAFTAKEIEPSEVPEFLRAIVGAHAVEGFGRDLAERIYKPNNAAVQKKNAEAIAKRQDGGIGPRRIAVRNEAGDIVHTLKDGVAMYDDINPLLDSIRRQRLRALSARLPGFHAASVWPADESDGAYFRIDATTAPEYRRRGVALRTAFFALDSILKARFHPLVDAPALSFVPSDTDTYSLHSYPFLMNAGFIETGRTMPFVEEVVVREIRAPSTLDVHTRLAEKIAGSVE